MKLTGVEVPFESLSNLEPDMVFVVVSDKDGVKKLIKVDNQSLPANEVVLRVKTDATTAGAQPQSGCYVWNGSGWVWKDPCPY